MMIITEEEHLKAQYGEVYERYCEEVPRYIVKIERLKRVPD
jgi:protein-S-isoprenylcysteine O-methyltransferase Ste14